jgi:copper chaperone CopZ
MKILKYIISTTVLVVTFLFCSYTSSAQFISAEIGVDGLTCSACTRSVEMSIRKLDFVQDVQMNLDNTMGTITFKTGAKIDIEKVAKAVINAGFSVRYLTAVFKTDNTITVSDNYCFAYGGDTYQFVKVSSTPLQNTTTFKFLGKEFLSSKDYKKWKADLKSQCTGAKNLYYVTL